LVLVFLSIINKNDNGCSNQPQKTIEPTFTHLYQKPTGKSVSMVFASYKTTMIANGRDVSLLRFSFADSMDMEILDARFSFEIAVKGDAEIFELNGDSPEIQSKTDTLIVWKRNQSRNCMARRPHSQPL
jgi:hypothetical protein